MSTDISIHDMPIKEFKRLIPVMYKHRITTNPGCERNEFYYSGRLQVGNIEFDIYSECFIKQNKVYMKLEH